MKCLILEDDPNLGFMLEEAILEMGHQPVLSRSISDAFYKMKTHRFDLLILDYWLPDGDSTQVSDVAAVTQPEARVILLTGSNVYGSGENAQLAPGVDWILRKPVPLDDLCALVDYALRGAPVGNMTA